MHRRTAALPALSVLVAVSLLGNGPCQEDDGRLTAGEAAEALDHFTVSEQALSLTSSAVEISTSFTIGDAVEAAAEELRTFIEQQLPCAEITREGATLTVEYGAKPGSCVYRGHVYHGQHRVTVTSTQPGEVVVDHAWDGFTNGVVTVTGTARVTWTAADTLRRNVVHALTWTRVADGREAVGAGDRTQVPLAGGLGEGIRIDGERSWTTDGRTWTLDIDGVEARWVDPIPQAGTYHMTTPFDGKVLTLTFERVDEDTIAATLRNGEAAFTFDVNRIGAATPQ